MEKFEVIGRGTWLDKVASDVVSREQSLGRSLSLLRVESGLGASGLPHIGSVGDAVRSYGIKLALESAGHKSELVAYSDDFDGLRKVPAGFPAWLKDYIAHPVSRIPDPFDCHSSYAEHVGALLKGSLDRLGIEYKFQSGAEAYKSGILNEQIRTILSHSKSIGKKINELVGQAKYKQNLPYTAVCGKCGRIYTTQSLSFDPRHDKVHYRCSGTELGEKFLKGCGYEGDAVITEGNGKLMWKVEFAARWAALGIRFEAYGKELTDSVKVNDWVAEHVLKYPPPFHARYELFQDRSGKKMSKSVGNLVTPDEWLQYASPESLRLMMYKRITGARSVSLEDVPLYMDEFDSLEARYFSKKRDQNPMKDAKERGLYEYSVFLKVPPKPAIHVPYRLIAQLASVAPQHNLEWFVLKRLEAYGVTSGAEEGVGHRIRWAADFAKREGDRAVPELDLRESDRAALGVFADGLEKCGSSDDVQNLAFKVAKECGMKPGELFPLIYTILLGVERGPRLGPYVIDSGVGHIASTIRNALHRGG